MEPEEVACNCDVENEQVCKTCMNETVQRYWTGVPLIEGAHMVDMELWAVEVWRWITMHATFPSNEHNSTINSQKNGDLIENR